MQFQSTQPEWAATVSVIAQQTSRIISIHAARVGCDIAIGRGTFATYNFNPRSPSGLRPVPPIKLPAIAISIHAARVGCDCSAFSRVILRPIFQSTQPEWAATYIPIHNKLPTCRFQSTQPEWAATPIGLNLRSPFLFQSTQPEWAATLLPFGSSGTNLDFNPRSPSGLRLIYPGLCRTHTQISIHAARVGCDGKHAYFYKLYQHFNPRSPSGLRRHFDVSTCRSKPDFNPRSPSGLRLLAYMLRAQVTNFNPRSPSGLRPER